jgi:predicted transcriptional regulator of viral defense system
MQTVTELALERAERGVFTREQTALWSGSKGASLDALLKRAVARGEVWRLRRGLYCLANRFARGRVNPLELAQRIYGPSYVSLETALSQHGWIPEGVQAITSVALARSRSFDTPVGLFSFTRVPQPRLLAGVRRTSVEGGGAFFLATPLKALADHVYSQRCDWRSAAPVVESLRVEEESLAELTGELFDEVRSAYKPGRVSRFLAGLRKDLKR